MKAVVAVLLVCVAVARASLIGAPLAGLVPGISNIQTLPAGLVAAHGGLIAAPAAISVNAIPAAIAAPAIAAPIVGAGYVAQTRGAVHAAPLPGHAIGSIHTNVAPAPGTI